MTPHFFLKTLNGLFTPKLKVLYGLVLGLLFSNACLAQLSMTENTITEKNHIAIAIHGGASDIKNLNLTVEQEKKYYEVLNQSLDSGYAVLRAGGKAEDAVVAAITVLEDSPLFNAGKGSVFTYSGEIEMDAAIMKGTTKQCGAVANVKHVKNPIKAARMVMDSSRFVFLSGEGADEFAAEHGLDTVPQDYFKTDFRYLQWKKVKDSDTTHLDNDGPLDERKINKFGTVGCVALDQYGNICAGTSTGGIVNKRYQRIGDSPLIGSGTYADERCGISCTGKGEDFIRLCVAHEIASKMKYKRQSLHRATETTIMHDLTGISGRGGCIAIDKKGNIEMPFTTSGMFRGKIDTHGEKFLAIYKSD